MNKFLKNKYVIFGLIGLSFYVYKRITLVKKVPKVKKSVEEIGESSVLDNENKNDEVKVSGDFIKDVEKMDDKTLKRTMETNKKILKRAKMSDKKRQVVKDMLAYMKKEYDNRTRNK